MKAVLEYADYAFCLLFFADFLLPLWRADDRTRYLLTWGWLDLVSSIPMLNAARWGRLARILRVIRVLRALRAARLLATAVLRQRAENGFLSASLVAILLVVFCSVAILQFETEAGSNIKTAEDAVWWSIATITTVGYGDRFPVTTEGRFVAAILMCAGVGLFSTFSGFLAAWFVAPDAESSETELAALCNEVASLRELIERSSPES